LRNVAGHGLRNGATVSVLPKEFVFENSVAELEDDQIDELILKLRQRVIEARAAPPTLLASPTEADNEPEPRH
jgi:hypothetical protein